MKKHKAEKIPLDDPELAGDEIIQGATGLGKLPDRLKKYGNAKAFSSDYAAWIREQAITESREQAFHYRRTARKLEDCASWMLFRHYYTVDKVRLHEGRFCKMHLGCLPCARMRAVKTSTAYMRRGIYLLEKDRSLKASHCILTIKNGDDLDERFLHLKRSFRTLEQRRKNVKRFKWNVKTCWGKVLGLAGAYEISNIGNGWHPHLHLILLHRDEIVLNELIPEWRGITRDSFEVRIIPLSMDDMEAFAENFFEVFKYACKVKGLSFAHLWEIQNAFFARRLIVSAGLFRGVQVPDDFMDDPLPEDLPFHEYLMRYSAPSKSYVVEEFDFSLATACV